MRYLRTLLFAGLSLCCSMTWGQPVSTQLKPGKVPEGTVYYLPKTVIHFHLLIERKVYTPGAFCDYAERYLHLQNIGKEKRTDHKLLNLQMSQTGVRDTSKCFVANLKGKSATAEIHLSDDAVLLAVNDSPILPQQPLPFVAAPKKTPSNPLLLLSGEARKAGSKARMAELTALQIAELQEHRQQLITGEAEEMPEDKAQLQLMLDEIDRQCEGLMSLFTGTTLCDTTEHVVSLCPDKEMKREVIFRISKQLGLVDKDDLSGIPFYVTLEDLHQQHQQDYEYPENKKDGGFYTNVPGFVRLTLYKEDRQLAAYTYPFAQFGFIELRSGSLFKKYPATQLVLNPITGAVERLHSDIPEKEE